MSNPPDDDFFERADAHIRLSNEQMNDATSGKVSASMLYGASRFNAWVSATGFSDGAEMAAHKQEALRFFTDEYAKMLEENLDDYIANFDRYMKPVH